MSTTQKLTRMFRIGTQTVADPAPHETPEKAFAMLAVAWPAIAHYTLDTPIMEGDRLIYPATRPPVQTKGATRAKTKRAASVPAGERDKALAALNAWADAETTAPYSAPLHQSVGSLLRSYKNKRPGVVDPFRIAMG